jgi:hypothetical protein
VLTVGKLASFAANILRRELQSMNTSMSSISILPLDADALPLAQGPQTALRSGIAKTARRRWLAKETFASMRALCLAADQAAVATKWPVRAKDSHSLRLLQFLAIHKLGD